MKNIKQGQWNKKIGLLGMGVAARMLIEEAGYGNLFWCDMELRPEREKTTVNTNI
jgi:hypothetical protein